MTEIATAKGSKCPAGAFQVSTLVNGHVDLMHQVLTGGASGRRAVCCLATSISYIGVSQIYGYHFGGPINKDYSILGSIMGSPYFGKLPYKL